MPKKKAIAKVNEEVGVTPTVEPEVTPTPVVSTPTTPTTPVKMSYEQKRMRTKEILDQQPKVAYRIPLGHKEKEGSTEVVVINGYSYIIKKGIRVEVPETIAQILDERFDAMESLGKTAGADGQDVRIDAALDRVGQNN